MSKKVASKPKALTQPKTAAVAIVPSPAEEPRCNPPFVPKECYPVTKWEGHDDTWEVLYFNPRAKVFYLDWSWSEPAAVRPSDALSWYGQKQALDIDYGELTDHNLTELIQHCAHELRIWEDIQKRGFDAWNKDRENAYEELLGSRKEGAK